MNTCNEKILDIGATLAVSLSTNSRIPMEAQLKRFNEELQLLTEEGIDFKASQVSKFLLAAVTVPIEDIMDLMDYTEAEIDEVISQGSSFSSPDTLRGRLHSIEGYADIDEITETISREGMQVKASVKEEIVGKLDGKVEFVDESSGRSLEKLEEINEQINVPTGTVFIERRKSRKERTQGLRLNSAASWSVFLDEHFNGMSSQGIEFSDFARDLIFDAMVRFDGIGRGFSDDVNAVINELLEDTTGKLKYYRGKKYSGNSLKEDIENNKTLQKKYFYDVLFSDFDFVLQSLVGSINIGIADTENGNSEVSGLMDDLGNEVDPLFNLSGLRDGDTTFIPSQTKGDESFTFQQDDNRIYSLPMDVSEFGRDRKLKRKKIYYLEADGKYFYKDARGANIDISPIKVYSYSTKNNRRTEGIDQEMNPFDMSTAFIVNLMPMFKIYSPTGKVVRRLNASDFLAIAPRLKGKGNDMESFRDALSNLSVGNSNIAQIANSIYNHAFRESATKGIHSLFEASQENPTLGGTNSKVVIALHNALINFDFNRYIKQEQKYVTTTYALGEGSQDDVVNNGLAPYIMKNGNTKYSIAQYMNVTGRNIGIRSTVTNQVHNIQSIAATNNGDGDSTTPSMASIAMQAGLHPLYTALKQSYDLIYSTDDGAKQAMAATFVDIFEISAYNLKKKPLSTRSVSTSGIKHSDYKRVPASTVIGVNLKNSVAVAFDVDNSKRINAGGKKMPSVEAPHRYALIKKQVELYKKALKINGGVLDFNPFLMTQDELTAKGSALFSADVGDIFIKTPIIYDGDSIAVSEWDLQTRLKQAMIDGFLDGPKKKGHEFFIQAMNFSDKSSIPLQQVKFKENLLARGGNITSRLKTAYIEYNINKNVALQKIMIGHLSSFIGGQYENILKHIDSTSKIYKEKKAEKKVRTDALAELREILVSKSYIDGSVDMTRPINNLMMKVNISADFIKFSDTELDAGADIVTFGKNPDPKYAGTGILKPHMGVRAEAYTENGEMIVQQALSNHRSQVVKLGMSKDGEVKSALAKLPGSTNISNVNDFYDRFFLVNGIYGHSIKVLTMGDESYFGTYYDQESIHDYYNNIDRARFNTKYIKDDGSVAYVNDPNLDYGLEEVRIMLQSQFKRAQSILTRGLSYSHKKTAVGLKRETIKEDVLQYMDVNSSIALTGQFNDEIETKYSFSFNALYDKTFEELEGLGVIRKLPADGPLVAQNKDGSLTASFQVGSSTIVMSNTTESYNELKNQGADPDLLIALHKLMEIVKDNSDGRGVVKGSYTANPFYDNGPDVVQYLSVRKLKKVQEDLSADTFAIMPDFIPTMTLSDPVSFVNVLNKMNVKQENSDAIQFIHPLLALILDNSRGNQMGAFHTKNQEAMKFLTTTVEYDRARQVLQKKSVQNPFTLEQMEKLGGTELFNMLRSMNTAMEFKQTNMVVEQDGKDVVMEFKNLEDLFNHFDGYSRGNDSAWDDVLYTLSRKENISNLYNFVGYVSVPSNQKTGHKKLNKFENHFNQRKSQDKINIDYTANEFNFEVLSKEHGYDVSGRLRDKSTIALLSQLVSAVAVGGNTNEITEDLQDSMSAMMDHSRMQIGAEFAHIGSELSIEPGKDPKKYNKVIERLNNGDFSTKGYDPLDMQAYSEVIRKSIYDIVVLALDNNMESEVTKKIAQDQNLSIDHPGAKRQILNTLRSALFKDSIKMDMSGFIATVSVGSNTMKFYTLPSGKRAGRRAYIIGGYKEGISEEITAKNFDDVSNFVLPYDLIQIPWTDKKGNPTTRLVRAGAKDKKGNPIGLTYTRQDDGTYKATGYPAGARVVITPDVYDAPGIRSVKKYGDVGQNELIKVSGFGVKPGVYFKWYFEELYPKATDRNKMLRNGHIAVDDTEKYSLRWSQYTKQEEGKETQLESTPAYRAFYRAAFNKTLSAEGLVNKRISEKDLDNLRAALVLETQSRDADGENIWEMSAPEVVLPTFMRAAYNLPQGVSLYDIIGYSGDRVDNVVEYFKSRVRLGKEFIPLTPREGESSVYLQMTRRIYTGEAARKNNNAVDPKSNYAIRIRTMLDVLASDALASYGVTDASELTDEQFNEFNDLKLSQAQVKEINNIISKAKSNHIQNMANSFLDSLEVVLTRIPGQTKQSGFYAIVVEFLDAQGNAAFAPTEHLVTTGGDFDIDTLSILTRAIDEKGIIYSDKDFRKDGRFDKVALQEQYKKDILKDRDLVIAAVAESNKRYVELARVRKMELNNATDPKIIADLEEQLLHAIESEITPEQELGLIRKSQRSIGKKYKNILSNTINGAVIEALKQVDTAVEINTPVSFSLFDPILKRIEQRIILKAKTDRSKTAKELKNTPVYSESGVNTMHTTDKEDDFKHYGNPWSATKMAGTIKVKSIEEAVQYYKEWLTTKKYDHIQPEQKAWILNEIKKGALNKKALLYSNKKDSSGTPELSTADALAEVTAQGPKSDNISGENYINVFEAEYTAAQGKEAIAIFATVLKINSAIQSAKLVFDKRYGDSIDFPGTKNPFFFNHEINFMKTVDGKPVKQHVTRHTFADTERYSTMNKLKTEETLKQALVNIGVSDNDFTEKAPQALVDLMEDEMFEVMKKASPNKIFDFSPEKVKILSDYYGKPMNGTTAAEILARYEKGKLEKMSQAEKAAIFAATGMDLNNQYAKDSLATYKTWLKSRIVKIDKAIFKSMAKDLFGIYVSNDILDSPDPLKAFREYLETDIYLVEDALKNAVGKTLSMDVQSQFLSAATDNAKELILARVKSNSLTNPIITTMMLLGYDIDVIIDFLYDPTIEAIVMEFSKRKNELQNVSLTAKGVSDLAVGGAKAEGPAKSSLISLLQVAEAFNKFRAVRSLNENTKIRQNQLDKIINDLNQNKLYPALRDKEISDGLEGKLTALITNDKKGKKDFDNPAKDIFNADQMVLLNSVTAKIYRHIFEVERNIIPAVSHNSTVMFEIADRTNGAGEKEYKNIDSFLSDKVTAAFYADPVGTKRVGRETVPVYRTGAVYEDGVITNVELNDQLGKSRFVDGFEAYFNYMKNRIGPNAAIDSMVYGKTFKATNPVLGIPKLRHAQPDSIEVSNILQGLKELKTDMKDAMTEDKLELYNNLANYAMIVSSAEVKKGTMIDVFLEINEDLAKFVNGLTLADYKKFIPRTNLAITLVKGNIPTVEKLERAIENMLANRRYGENAEINDYELQALEAAMDAEVAAQESLSELGLEDNVDHLYMGDEEYTEEERKVFTYAALSDEAASPTMVTSATAGEFYRIIDKDISDAIFYGHNAGEIAYRIFPAGSKESNPIATLPTSKYLSTVNKDLMQDLADIGMQIGYNAEYNKKNIQIISYAETQAIDGNYHDIYNIWYDGKPGTAKGLHLMQDNEGLDLRKNIIRPLRSGDVDRYNNYREILDAMPVVDREVGLVDPGVKNAPQMNTAFIGNESLLLSHPVAKKEARQIASVLTLSAESKVPENEVYNIYHRSGALDKASQFSRTVLVPSLFKRKVGTKTYVREDSENIEMKKNIIDLLNNLAQNSKVSLYGIKSYGKKEYDGGMDIVDSLLSDLWDNAEYDTFFNGHFKVEESLDAMSGIVTKEITRTVPAEHKDKTRIEGKPIIQMVGGKIIPIFTQDKIVEGKVIGQIPLSTQKFITRQSSIVISDDAYRSAVIAAIIDGKIDIPFKKAETTHGNAGMARTEYVSLPPGKDGKPKVFIMAPGSVNEFMPVKPLHEKYGGTNRIVPELSEDGKVIRKEYYAVPHDKFNEMADMNPGPKVGETTIIKKGC